MSIRPNAPQNSRGLMKTIREKLSKSTGGTKKSLGASLETSSSSDPVKRKGTIRKQPSAQSLSDLGDKQGEIARRKSSVVPKAYESGGESDIEPSKFVELNKNKLGTYSPNAAFNKTKVQSALTSAIKKELGTQDDIPKHIEAKIENATIYFDETQLFTPDCLVLLDGTSIAVKLDAGDRSQGDGGYKANFFSGQNPDALQSITTAELKTLLDNVKPNPVDQNVDGLSDSEMSELDGFEFEEPESLTDDEALERALDGDTLDGFESQPEDTENAYDTFRDPSGGFGQTEEYDAFGFPTQNGEYDKFGPQDGSLTPVGQGPEYDGDTEDSPGLYDLANRKKTKRRKAGGEPWYDQAGAKKPDNLAGSHSMYERAKGGSPVGDYDLANFSDHDSIGNLAEKNSKKTAHSLDGYEYTETSGSNRSSTVGAGDSAREFQQQLAGFGGESVTDGEYDVFRGPRNLSQDGPEYAEIDPDTDYAEIPVEEESRGRSDLSDRSMSPQPGEGFIELEQRSDSDSGYSHIIDGAQYATGGEYDPVSTKQGEAVINGGYKPEYMAPEDPQDEPEYARIETDSEPEYMAPEDPQDEPEYARISEYETDYTGISDMENEYNQFGKPVGDAQDVYEELVVPGGEGSAVYSDPVGATAYEPVGGGMYSSVADPRSVHRSETDSDVYGIVQGVEQDELNGFTTETDGEIQDGVPGTGFYNSAVQPREEHGLNGFDSDA